MPQQSATTIDSAPVPTVGLLNVSGCPIAPPASWTTAAVVPVVALRCLCVHGAGAFAEYELTALVVAGDHEVLPDPSVIV